MSAVMLTAWVISAAVWSWAFDPIQHALVGVNSRTDGRVEVATISLGKAAQIPPPDAFGRTIPRGNAVVVVISGCTKCSFKSVDISRLRSTVRQPTILFLTDPISMVASKLPKSGLYVVHDPFMRYLPQTLYAGAPEARS